MKFLDFIVTIIMLPVVLLISSLRRKLLGQLAILLNTIIEKLGFIIFPLLLVALLLLLYGFMQAMGWVPGL
jgi:hypothetical protein